MTIYLVKFGLLLSSNIIETNAIFAENKPKRSKHLLTLHIAQLYILQILENTRLYSNALLWMGFLLALELEPKKSFGRPNAFISM